MPEVTGVWNQRIELSARPILHISHNVKVFLSQSQHPAWRIKPRAGEEMGFMFTLEQNISRLIGLIGVYHTVSVWYNFSPK